MDPLVLNVKAMSEMSVNRKAISDHDQKSEIFDKIFCEICDTEMYEKHCKIICPNCGFKWDCSDH